MWSKARLLCLFSLVLYCFDSGSDTFVSVSLFLRCHYYYGATVISLVFLPGVVYGGFEYFKLSERSWRDFFGFFFLYPIYFQPFCLWRLYKAVVESEDEVDESSEAEDKAKRYIFNLESVQIFLPSILNIIYALVVARPFFGLDFSSPI